MERPPLFLFLALTDQMQAHRVLDDNNQYHDGDGRRRAPQPLNHR